VQYIQYRTTASPTDSLFIAKKTGKAMTKSGIYHIIKNIGKHIPGKNVTPHILRHTGASYDGEYLNEAMLCKKYGWSIGSKMASRYCHFSEQQLEQQLMKQAGIIKEDIIQGKVCPRCGSINNINAEHCTKCQQLLDTKKLIEESQQLIQEQETQAEKIAQMEKQMEVFAATIRNMNFFKHGYITPDGTELLVDDKELVKDYTQHQEDMKYIRKHGIESWRKMELAKREKEK
jgi:ribosomal protein L40E